MGYSKENYQYYKRIGICTHCHREKAEEGRVLCLMCKMDNRKYKKKYDPEKTRARDKAKREYRKANGLCTNCGARPQQHKLLCHKCHSTILRRKEKNGKIPRCEWVAYGLCYSCGKEGLMEGKKVCAICYEKKYKSISKIMNMSAEQKNTQQIKFKGGCRK